MVIDTQEPTVTITRTQFWEAWGWASDEEDCRATGRIFGGMEDYVRELARRLGLGEK